MSSSDWNLPQDAIRISREEAASSHVDDLLARQKSLRGEPGIARHGRGRWYYQNWFVFGVAGTLAALLGWGLIEPHFNDLHYLQGRIERLDPSEPMPSRFTFGNQYLELRVPGRGWVEIRRQRIWVLTQAKELRADGTREPVQLDKLRVGDEIGFYVEYLAIPGHELAIGRFLVPSPPPQSASEAAESLADRFARSQAAGLLVFPVIAGLIGLAIGGVDGVVCRLLRRAVLAGLVGLIVGFIGGFISSMLANLVYAPLTQLAMRHSGESFGKLTTFGFLIQMGGRALAWGLAGMAMGLGQGLALRSKRLLLYGFLGGIVGGLLGGLLFDPIDLLLLGMEKPSAHWSRLVGFGIIGASVGLMIGLVELLTRDAWLRMTEGPLAGKEFLVFKDTLRIGSSPRSDIYIFNDPDVAHHHATLRSIGDTCEIENHDQERPALLNGRPIRTARLRHGDTMTLGRTVFTFQRRQG